MSAVAMYGAKSHDHLAMYVADSKQSEGAASGWRTLTWNPLRCKEVSRALRNTDRTDGFSMMQIWSVSSGSGCTGFASIVIVQPVVAAMANPNTATQRAASGDSFLPLPNGSRLSCGRA